MLTEVILLLSVLVVVYYAARTKLPKNIPPGPFSIPGIGNLLQLALSQKKTPSDTFHELSKKYGPITFLQLGLAYQVVLEDYDIIKEALSDELWVDRLNTSYLKQRSFEKNLGILLVGGSCWKEMRKFTTRTLRDFGFAKEKSMEMTLQDELIDLTMNLENQINLGKGQTTMRINQFFTISILNVLWNMIAGFRFSHDDIKVRDLLYIIEMEVKGNALGSLTSPLYVCSIFPFLYIVYYYTNYQVRNRQNRLHNYFREILHDRRAEGNYQIEQRDYIDVFLLEIERHKNDPIETNFYTDEQFIVVTMDLFMAGSETTKNTIEFAFLYLMKNLQVQKKVQEEIDTIVGYDRLPCISDKPNLPYTEATILEIQRHANVLPISIRTPIKDTTLGGYRIPAGTAGIINLQSMHMDEKTWGDPLCFRPERFLNSQNQFVNGEKILPYGLGKRGCLGEKLATVSVFTYITTMLQKFSFEESPLHILPSIEPIVGFTLSPQPYYAVIKNRHTVMERPTEVITSNLQNSEYLI